MVFLIQTYCCVYFPVVKIQITVCYLVQKTAKYIKKAHKLKIKELRHVFMENNYAHTSCRKIGKM